MMTYETLTVRDLLATQVVVPDWLKRAVFGRLEDSDITVAWKVTPFGRYLMAVDVDTSARKEREQ